LFMIFGTVVLITVGNVALLQKRWRAVPQGSEA